jgi:hypothetical protein
MKTKLMVFLLASGLLSGCYAPKEDAFVEDLDLVVVDYDEEFNFAAPQTFFMPDSISRGEISDDDDDTGRYDDQILEQIRSNMLAKGFTEVDEANVENADVVMLISAARTNTVIIGNPCFWGCWGWYPWPPGWGWGPGWGWPYPPTVVGSYSKGTLFMNMIDPTDRQDQELDQVWAGVINGLLQGSDENILQRVNNSIDKAFELSPYLNR